MRSKRRLNSNDYANYPMPKAFSFFKNFFYEGGVWHGMCAVSAVDGTFSWWHFSTMLPDMCVNNWHAAPLKVRDNGGKGQGNIRTHKIRGGPGFPATVTCNSSIFERPGEKGKSTCLHACLSVCLSVRLGQHQSGTLEVSDIVSNSVGECARVRQFWKEWACTCQDEVQKGDS